MPFCGVCKAERLGNFCSTCGNRVADTAGAGDSSSAGATVRRRGSGVAGGERTAPPPAGGGSSARGGAGTGGSPVSALPMEKLQNAPLGVSSFTSLSSMPSSATSTPQVAPAPAGGGSPVPDENAKSGLLKRAVPVEAQTLIAQARHGKVNTRRRETTVGGGAMSRITVAVRKKPLCAGETPVDMMAVTSLNTAEVLEPKKSVDNTPFLETQRFVFDEVFDETDDNVTVYKRTAKRLVKHIFEGGFCCCFAYGQTGSGKTFTMMGSGATNLGVYIQAANEIFELRGDQPLSVVVSFYEIYAAKLYDLLNDKEQVYSREDGNQTVHIRGLTEHVVRNSKQLMELVRRGLDSRSQSTTVMNDESSRSHAIMEIKLKVAKTNKLVGKLSVIDLAGSERAAVGHAGDKQTQMEGAEINKSLLALKECIRALDQGARHVPFRQSELTQILKESFVGENGHTVMIANVSCSTDNIAETVNTLRYAYRVKELKTDDDDAVPPPSARRPSAASGAPQTASQANVPCPGCGQAFAYYAFLEAHKEECELSTVSCTFCSASFKRKDEARHQKTCAKLPVRCSLGCGDEIPRDQLKKHQNAECPKSETSCLFCRLKIFKQDQETHKLTCEQRIVECEGCEGKVKWSMMTAHKRTCKKTKRESTVSGASRSVPVSPISAGPRGDMPRPSLASQASTSSSALLKDARTGRDAKVLPEPTGSGKTSPAGSPPSSRPSSSSGTKERRASTVGVSPTAGAPAPAASSSAMPAAANVVKPTPPARAGVVGRTKTPPTTTAAAKGDGGSGGCSLSLHGCQGGPHCNSDAHLSLLMTLYAAQSSENAKLRSVVETMDERVQRLEAALSQQQGGGSAQSKFAALNGLRGLSGAE